MVMNWSDQYPYLGQQEDNGRRVIAYIMIPFHIALPKYVLSVIEQRIIKISYWNQSNNT